MRNNDGRREKNEDEERCKKMMTETNGNVKR
jgi:hypothetical protein